MLHSCFINLAIVIGLLDNFGVINIFYITRIVLSSAGILISAMHMEKQLFGESHYGDRVCSLFHHADCNSVLDGAEAKVFGISWSEVGLGYFTANILLLSLFPVQSCFVAVINWVAMFYGIWSIYYQWRTKSWCVLCVITQAIIWIMGITAIYSHLIEPFIFDIVNGLLSCIVFALCIMVVHLYVLVHTIEDKRIRAVQQYRALKANTTIAKVLIEGGKYYETTYNNTEQPSLQSLRKNASGSGEIVKFAM